MKIASNVIEKSKFAVEKALMLKFNIAYIANWYFSLDLQVMHYRKVIQIVIRKMKTAYCAVFKL